MIYVALGSNLPGRFGSPRDTMMAAQDILVRKGVKIVASSQIWLTAPVPLSDQPWYHNSVIRVETDFSTWGLLECLHAVEDECGRERTVRNASRTLDLDLLAYDDVVINKPELIVPHPRMHERAFVLLPMSEVAPANWLHPVLGKRLSELLKALPEDQEAMPMTEADKAGHG